MLEVYLLDNIVNNVIHKKKKVKKQLALINELFLESMERDIGEEDVDKRICKIKIYKDTLKWLLTLPKIEQRSQEWYDIRKQLITASDFAQALGKGKFGTKMQFYKNKCGYEENKVDMTIPALQWGVRYEEVANKFYKLKMNVDVHEFGILQHHHHKFIGASPDGISNMGIMLEIKCPWKRVRTDTIPEQYYYQIQGQLEVCNLEECDYLECYIKEYDTREDMKNDDTVKYKGVIVERIEYEYGEINELEYGSIYDPNDIKNIYFYGIKEYFMKRVYRDREFFKTILPEIESVWSNVESYRKDEELYRQEIKTTTRARKKPMFMFREVNDDNI